MSATDVRIPSEDDLLSLLDESGQLERISAALKATMFASLHDEKDKFPDTFALSQKQKALLSDPVGRATLHLVAEFLDVMRYDATASVFAGDAGIPYKRGFEHKAEASKVFGSSDVRGEPLLMQLLRRQIGGGGSAVGNGQQAPQAATASVAPASAPAAAPAKRTRPPPKSIEETYVLSRHENREFVRKHGDVTGQGMNIDILKNCKVHLFDCLDSLNIDECEDCEFVIGPTMNSVFFRDCKNCTLTVACKQLRLRTCFNMDIRLFAQTDPVVESSHNVRFRPFNAKLPWLVQSFKDSGLDPALNRYIHVYDFTPDAPELPKGPHFTVDHSNHGLSMVQYGAEYATPDAPPQIEDLLAGRIECAESCEKKNASQDIKQGGVTKPPPQVAQTEAGLTPPGGNRYEEFEVEEEDDDDEF